MTSAFGEDAVEQQYALIRDAGTLGGFSIVRVVKLGKRYSRVETFTSTGERFHTWQPLTRELAWRFDTLEAAEAKLAELKQVERDFIAERNAKLAEEQSA
jgi:hypothetical protein